MSSAVAKRLKGKTVVITGASSGIGRSTAFEFARTAPKNLKLVLTARRIDTLKQIAADIVAEVGEGVRVLPVQLDVSNPEEVKTFVGKLPEEFGDINVLVNNAYVFDPIFFFFMVHTEQDIGVSSKVSPGHPRLPRKTSTSCSIPTLLG